jgi:hypothetical protein
MFSKKAKLIENRFRTLGNFSQDAGTPGTEGAIAFLQLAVKGLKC